MSDSDEFPDLPAALSRALVGIPAALVPSSIKALDRLIGAAVDLPTAILAQQKARIDAQTASYQAVERAIAVAAALEAGGNPETVKRAVTTLVRKAYRKEKNVEAVALAMAEELSRNPDQQTAPDGEGVIDDDWLNVFERFAEDASSERLQQLWGRVLAGEVRKPGCFSIRTLRFLSEFSKADAEIFDEFAKSVFGDFAPLSLVKPEEDADLRNLLHLESIGVIHDAAGKGLALLSRFGPIGTITFWEGPWVLVLSGTPGELVSEHFLKLTPVGIELLRLLPGRDPAAAARRVAFAVRRSQYDSASILRKVSDDGTAVLVEVLWNESQTNTDDCSGA